MLVLARKLTESLRLRIHCPDGETIDAYLTVMEIGHQVRLGFEGPSTIDVARLEITGEPPRVPVRRAIA